MEIDDSENQLDILQKLHAVEREIAKARKQALYRNSVPNTCLLEGYCNRELSFILNLEARCVEDVVFPIHAFCRNGITSVQFSVFVSYGNSSDMTDWVEAEKQKMLIGDVQIVKSPDGTIMPSVVWLNLGHDAIPESRTAGIYINAVKGSLDVLPRFSNGEFSVVRDFVRKESADCATPCEIQSTSQIVDSITSNERQIIQSFPRIRDFVLQQVSALFILLDCHCTSIFERDNGGCKVRDMFLGSINLEAGISVKCTHERFPVREHGQFTDNRHQNAARPPRSIFGGLFISTT